MDKIKIVVEDVLASLQMRDSVRQVYTEETDSPWNEKALIKRKKEYLDVKIFVWNVNIYLYGRIYRLLLYIHDVLDPFFGYDSKGAPGEEETGVREIYSQIWGIYVDSRLERARIPNFYDRLLRRSQLAEALKKFEWKRSHAFFDALWKKERLTHAEIVRYAYDPSHLAPIGIPNPDALEVKIGSLLRDHSVKKHLDRLTSDRVKGMAEDILNYTVYHCRDALIMSSYFGIRLSYKDRTFAEIVIESSDRMLITLHNPASFASATAPVTETTDLQAVQNSIKEVFSMYYVDMQSV